MFLVQVITVEKALFYDIIRVEKLENVDMDSLIEKTKTDIQHGHTCECIADHEYKHTHTHQCTENVIRRLAKAAGHLDSVKRMVERGEECDAVLIQLAAVIGALNSTGKVILKDHLEHCIVDAIRDGDQESIQRLNKAIDIFVK